MVKVSMTKMIFFLRHWADHTMNVLPTKSMGRTVMTSDFVSIKDGFLRYNDEVWEEVKNSEDVRDEIIRVGEERARRAGSILDVTVDGYYNSDRYCVSDRDYDSDFDSNYSNYFESD